MYAPHTVEYQIYRGEATDSRRTSWAEAVAKKEKKRFEEHKGEGGQIRL